MLGYTGGKEDHYSSIIHLLRKDSLQNLLLFFAHRVSAHCRKFPPFFPKAASPVLAPATLGICAWKPGNFKPRLSDQFWAAAHTALCQQGPLEGGSRQAHGLLATRRVIGFCSQMLPPGARATAIVRTACAAKRRARFGANQGKKSVGADSFPFPACFGRYTVEREAGTETEKAREVLYRF